MRAPTQRRAPWQRALAAIALSLLAITGLAAPASANTGSDEPPIEIMTTGQRMANADGDTAGRCLTDVSGYLFQWDCDPANRDPLQNWVLARSGIVLHLRHPQGGCVGAGGVGVGGLPTVQVCALIPSQSWIRSAGGWFELRNVQTGLCLDVRGFGTGSVVQMWTCTGGGNQKWKLY